MFDAIIPIVSGQQNGSATITYRTDNKAAAELICKISWSVAGWFYGYWIHVQHYKLGMVKKLMEIFDINSALLARFSVFDPVTLIVKTTFGDVDKQLEWVEEDLGINQGWNADSELGDDSRRVNLIGHREALVMTLRDRVDDVDDADRSGPSCRTNFSQSTRNSTAGFSYKDVRIQISIPTVGLLLKGFLLIMKITWAGS